MTQTEQSTVRLSVPAKPDYVVIGRLALSAVCRMAPLDADDVADLKLALTEAATTFVGDGELDGCDADAPLTFAFDLHDDRVAIEVGCDGGPALSEEERELGVAIMEATVDDVAFDDGSLRLVKYPAERSG